MYRIVLKNVGKDMLNKDFTVDAGNITGATVKAFKACEGILGLDEWFHFSVVGDELFIIRCGVTVGSLSITKLN